jgi:glycosyltransferase involved in cell wall biosynthesis
VPKAPRTNDRPLVSIVTPSLDQGGTIAQTLRSVREQSYPNIEHIVVDGGSTDGTLEILREAEAGSGLRWSSEPDSGMYAAINKGFSHAAGDILAYLNTDDSYFPWTVETAVDALQAHPEAGFVFGDLLVLWADGNLQLDFHSPFRLAYLRRHAFLAQPTVFFRRSVWEEVGPFDESLQLLGDCEYWMRIAERSPGRKVNEVLALQREHPAAKRYVHSELVDQELGEIRARYPKPGRTLGYLARIEAGLWRRRLAATFLLRTLTSRGSSWPGFLGDARWRRSVAPVRLAGTLLPVVGRSFAPGALKEPER